MKSYDAKKIEKKWQAIWDEKEIYQAKNPDQPGFVDKPKFYVLDMFPYPSGSGLHVGHASGYIGTDIIARRKRMEGFNVLHPIGWDAFGLPAEQYAIRTGRHPSETTAVNCKNFRRQLKLLGLSYDWSREINTSDPNYYKWTQWMFLKLYEMGLVYQAESSVWWCEDLKTVLSNEEVISGRSERGNYPCVRRSLRQWMIKITKYAERLLNDLEKLDWPESIKAMQRAWIGRSEGAEINFPLEQDGQSICVFTTRPETIFGCSAVIVSPEHPIVSYALIQQPEDKQMISNYLSTLSTKSDRDRKSVGLNEVSGVFSGLFVKNPLAGPCEHKSSRRIPIYISDYVLMDYGTGAIMCVPSHDKRDFAFSENFRIDRIPVVALSSSQPNIIENYCFDAEGTMINSEFLNDMSSCDARDAVIDVLIKNKIGKRAVHFKLRDWLFSRQRYWGEPFPLLHKNNGEITLVPDTDLPVMLPQMSDFTPSEDGSPPLARAKDWVNTPSGQRETSTMPGWAGSCWYFLRFMDPNNTERPFSEKSVNYWGQVDLYVGGAAHAVLHLLYARFWHKVLYDLGIVLHDEPFKRLFNQGMVTAYAFKDESGRLVESDSVRQENDKYINIETGEHVSKILTKMAKSLKNVVNPDDMIDKFGADTLRVYEVFMGPLDADKIWTSSGMIGCSRFLKRVWKMCLVFIQSGVVVQKSHINNEIDVALNDCLRKVNHSFDNYNFNTAVAAMMECLNILEKNSAHLGKMQIERFILMLSPFAPHICEEIWELMGHASVIVSESWPEVQELDTSDGLVNVVIQVNGKFRKIFTVPRGINQKLLEDLASDAIRERLDRKCIANVIIVPDRIINFVLG